MGMKGLGGNLTTERTTYNDFVCTTLLELQPNEVGDERVLWMRWSSHELWGWRGDSVRPCQPNWHYHRSLWTLHMDVYGINLCGNVFRVVRCWCWLLCRRMNRWAVFCCALVDEAVLLSVKFTFPQWCKGWWFCWWSKIPWIPYFGIVQFWWLMDLCCRLFCCLFHSAIPVSFMFAPV